MAMTMALAAAGILPLPDLRRPKPDPRIFSGAFCILMVSALLFGSSAQVASMVMLINQPWFAGGNGTPFNVSSSFCLVLLRTHNGTSIDFGVLSIHMFSACAKHPEPACFWHQLSNAFVYIS